MKAATKLLIRRMAREQEARAMASLRAGQQPHMPVMRAGTYGALSLPLSYTPYRLQAADRWRREDDASGVTPKKRQAR